MLKTLQIEESIEEKGTEWYLHISGINTNNPLRLDEKTAKEILNIKNNLQQIIIEDIPWQYQKRLLEFLS